MHVEPKPNSSLGNESCLPEKKHLRDVLWLTHESFKSNACDHTQGEIRPPSSLQHTSHSVLPTLLGKKKKISLYLVKSHRKQALPNAPTTRGRDKTGKPTSSRAKTHLISLATLSWLLMHEE